MCYYLSEVIDVQKKLLPFIVTTFRGLVKCVKGNAKLIYIHPGLYKKARFGIRLVMKCSGYALVSVTCRGGLFYSKGIDMTQYEIPDLYKLY